MVVNHSFEFNDKKVMQKFKTLWNKITFSRKADASIAQSLLV